MYSLFRTLSLRHLRRRAGRAMLVVVSIALGVATLVSAQALNQSMGAAARTASTPLAGAAELLVANSVAGVGGELAAELRSVPGIRSVQPLIIERVQITEPNRVALVLGVERPNGAAPEALGVRVTITRPQALLSQYPVLVGDELAKEITTPTIRVQAVGHEVELAVLGTVSLSGPAADLGRNLLVLDLDRAEKLFNTPGRVSRIDLFVEPNASVPDVRAAAQAVVGTRAQVQTPDAYGQAVQDVISGVQAGFALSSAGALVIGIFLVYNALSVSVAERRHEIGIMRSLGATRRQVAGLFAGEAAALGLVGAILGLPLGLAFAKLALGPMQQVLSEIFLSVEARQVHWEFGTLAWALVAGVAAAVIASLVPALQAASDAPADAVRRSPSSNARFFRIVQGGASAAFILIGLGLAAAREHLPIRVGSFGGLTFFLFGSLLAAPLFVALGARILLPLLRFVPDVGVRLAADNLLRAPGRTGVVIAAFAAGVALTVQTAGVRISNQVPVLDWLDHSVTPDLLVFGGDTTISASANLPMDVAFGREIAAIPGVRRAVPARFQRPSVNGITVLLIAFDAAGIYAANRDRPDYPGLDLFAKLTEPGTAIVSDNFATLNNVRVGDMVTLPGVRGPATVRVIGTLLDFSWSHGTVFIDRSTLRDIFEDARVDIFDVFLDDSVVTRASAEAAVRALAGRNALAVMTRNDLRSYISGVIERFYTLVQVQQMITAIVATLGIVTALLISVLQRQRELGLLRAVGATQSQIVRSILAEAALMGFFGTLFGLLIGVPLEWYALRVVIAEEAGFALPVIVPWGEWAIIAVAAGALATLAGLIPALRARQLNIAEAVVYD